MITEYHHTMDDGRVAKLVLLMGEQPEQPELVGGSEPDPEWRYTDRAGHQHDAGMATLEWVVTGRCSCSLCAEAGEGGEHRWGEWRCRLCGQPVLPGVRAKAPALPEMSGTVVYGGCLYKLTAAEVAALRGGGINFGAWVAAVTGRAADGLASL